VLVRPNVHKDTKRDSYAYCAQFPQTSLILASLLFIFGGPQLGELERPFQAFPMSLAADGSGMEVLVKK